MQVGAAFTQPTCMGLIGHLIYGAITGLAYVWYTHRSCAGVILAVLAIVRSRRGR